MYYYYLAFLPVYELSHVVDKLELFVFEPITSAKEEKIDRPRNSQANICNLIQAK